MVDETAGAQLRRLGITEMDPELALSALGQALDHEESHLVVADIDWTRFAPVYTLARDRPLLRALPEVRALLDEDGPGESACEQPGEGELAGQLAALSPAEQHRLLLDLVRAHVAVVLGYGAGSEVEPGRAFKELGFDSVAAVDLRNRLRAASGLPLPATVVFDYATPAALAEHLWSGLCQTGSGPELPLAAELDRLESRVTALSPEQAERIRLAPRLQALLTMLNEAAAVSSHAALASRLAGATAQDVFDLIDEELGSG